MFAKKLAGFSLACLLAASTAFAVEEHEPLTAADGKEQAAPDFGITPDKLVPDDAVATGSDGEQPVDADS